MSYCVNCGVELEASLRRCPLCNTEVINPNNRDAADPAARPYPSKVELLERRAIRRFFLMMATLMLLIPPVVCLICDVLGTGRITWSAYVVGATAMAYVYVLVPFAAEKPNAWLCIALDCGVTLLFLYAIAVNLHDTWFVPLALPITLAVFVAVAVMALLFKKTRAKFVRLAGILFASGILCAGINLIVNLHLDKTPVLFWSLFVLVPCLIFGGISLIVNNRLQFKEEMRRRFFI